MARWDYPITAEPGIGLPLATLKEGERFYGDAGKVVTVDGLQYVPLCELMFGTSESTWTRYLPRNESDVPAEDREQRQASTGPLPDTTSPAAPTLRSASPSQPETAEVQKPRRLAAPDMSELTAEERQAAEFTCEGRKLVAGPAAYYECLRDQVRALGLDP